jgi:hypothetical protein
MRTTGSWIIHGPCSSQAQKWEWPDSEGMRPREKPTRIESVFGLRDRADHLDEAYDGAKNDSPEKEPVGVEPVVEEFAQQQADDNGCGNDESNLRVARPNHRGVVGLAFLLLVLHAVNVPLRAHARLSSRRRRLTGGLHVCIIKVRGGAVW